VDAEYIKQREALLNPLPLIDGPADDTTLTNSLFAYNWRATSRGWWAMLLVAAGGVGMLLFAIGYTLVVGIGAWGNQIPVAWAFGIVNFVWWIGIGHAGTLISAILLLLLQKWRTSINRFAEAMTLFAVVCAGMFPVLHLGRPWFAYWLFPYPSTMRVWPQFRSPLVWDVFAVSTYLTVSFLFWYLGLLPDVAALRDASQSRAKRIVYGIMAMGWRGSGRHWQHYQSAYLLLGGLATPLVVSVHTIVSFDFATSLVPGWHETVFPPYFVAGAIFSGFALVLTLMIPARRILGLKQVVTARHLDAMCKFLLTTSFMVGYGYFVEQFMTWYGGDTAELGTYWDRAAGAYAPVYWLLILCNVIAPQLFWFARLRRNVWVIWIVSVLINVGMWCERFVIVVQSLTHDYLPSSWRIYGPTWVDISLYAGTLGFFMFAFLLFLRFLPAVSVTEVKELNHELRHEHGKAAA
jgi:molybdopterin-containing oxidoreductase family membrane subunit